MKWLILIFLMIVIINNSWAQNSDCKVLHKAIEGTYEGGCDKSKANGQGKAAGTDSYEGTFKNGLPEGYGKYIWHDGHYYVGLFKKGIRKVKVICTTKQQMAAIPLYPATGKKTNTQENTKKVLN